LGCFIFVDTKPNDGYSHPDITVFPTRLDRVYEVVNPFLVELIFVIFLE